MLLQRRLSARVARGWHRAKAEECVTASDTYTGVPKKATHFVTVGGGHAHATAAEGERREKEVEVQGAREYYNRSKYHHVMRFPASHSAIPSRYTEVVFGTSCHFIHLPSPKLTS